MKALIVLFVFISSTTIAQVAKSPEEVSPLLIGQQVPDISLKSADNRELQLRSLVAEKPTVLLFYRGGWCPYCNAHLSEIQEAEEAIIEQGYQILAISPDAPANLQTTEDDKQIHYQLYSDADGTLMKAMGIAFKAPENYLGLLEKSSEGENQGILPVPSVFMLDTNGNIEFEYVNPDYKTRISGKLLLAIIENLH